MVTMKPANNRLAELAARPGGLPDEALIERASANLDELRPLVAEALQAALEDLERLARGGAGPASVRPAALKIIEAAAPAGFPELGAAAHSLCDLLEAGPPGSAAVREGLRLHLDAIGLLGRQGADSRGAQEVVAGLRAVVRRIAETAA